MNVADALRRRRDATPDRTVVIDGDHEFSFAELWRRSELACSLLRDLGVTPGAVVSMQLPNWFEALPIMLGTALAGGLINPIVPIYREAEVGFIIADARSALIAVPDRFRSFAYRDMAERAVAATGIGTRILTLRAEAAPGERLPERTLSPASTPAIRGEDAPSLLMYTSGTTGHAKGVLHSGATLSAELRAMADYWQVTADDIILMPSPLTHITGYLCGYELPIRAGARVVLMDRWDADEAVRLIDRHGVTMMVAATPFLVELVDRAEALGTDLPSLRLFPCGGAPVAPELIHRAHRVLRRCLATRVYGSTEAPTITLGVRSRAEARAAAETEGRVIGHEIRLVREDGSDADLGEDGEVVTRGPELFLGYLNPDDGADAYTADGYFRTGDLARFDADGMLVITGRKKDLIIRGGENIGPKEIEDVLLSCSEIAEAAVVAMPSPRLGETVCAFVVGRSGPPDEAALRGHVAAAGLARQKWPERYFAVASLPKTAAGKVRKDLLRARSAEACRQDAPTAAKVDAGWT